jgi:hypothetical protein
MALLASIVGALVLGEYQFEGLMPFGAGLLFGLVVGELVVSIAHSRSRVLACVSAVLVACGLGWAAWISSGEGLRPFPAMGWVAMALGAVATLARVGDWKQGKVRAAG